MNILLIEDDRELLSSAVEQLELKGYRIYPAYSISESQAVLNDQSIRIDLIIADHELPDGRGVKFLIEHRAKKPHCHCAVVSGCLTAHDIVLLEENEIPYFHKPLLYVKVIEELRKKAYRDAPIHVEPEPESESSEEPEAEEQPKKWTDKLRGFWPDI